MKQNLIVLKALFHSISHHIKNNEVKIIIKNFISLSSLNVLNFIFPLILIPYLTYTIGIELYGQYALSSTIFNYGLLLVNFGFDFSATKLISINRDDKSKIADILSNVTTIRIIFSFVASVGIAILTYSIPNLVDNSLLYILGIGILWGQAITPFWLFQGLEKMGYITIINLFARVISTILIFIFIRKPEYFFFINLFQSSGYLIAGITGLFLIRYQLKIKFVKPVFKSIKYYFLDSWHIFLSTLSMSFYREANIIILGITTNYQIVGQYAAIEKVVKAIQSFMDPLAKALFPFFGRKLNDSYQGKTGFINFGKVYALLLLLATIALFLIGPYLLIWYLGQSFISGIIIFQVLVPVILFGGLNYYLGIIGLINLGMNKYFSKAVFVTGLFSISACYVLSQYWSSLGGAIAMTSSELMLLILIYRKIYPWLKK